MSDDLRRRIYLTGIFLLAVTVIGTTGYYLLGQLEQPDPPWGLGDCFYMTAITLTTVGFGEVINLNLVPGARLFTIFILFSGLGVAAYFVSTLTAFLVDGELTNVFWRKRMETQINKLTGHIILCGAVGAGFYVIKELHLTGVPFVLIDLDVKLIKILQSQFGNFPAVVGDPTHADDLENAGVKKAKGVISALDNDKDNLCVVVTCKLLNPEIKLFSSCRDREFAGKLELLGAEVVMPNAIGGLRIASQMIRPKVVGYLDLMMRDKNCIVRIEDITLSTESSLVGKPVGDINFPAFAQLLILALIRKNNPTIIYNPNRSMIMEAGDTLILQADVDSLERFRNYHG
ncbi:potassium channel protein [Desulfobacula sp.]|uniref:potassium channel family protein n=1 Tax=Desulfobacula sp. TaxID=2593537 RepID=UPI002602168D|nr:potassium channel protein [Desulfobacula sp.]